MEKTKKSSTSTSTSTSTKKTKQLKPVFIVRGSEDGDIGVYSNKKRAYVSAYAYMSICDDHKEINTSIYDPNGTAGAWFHTVKASYTNVLKALNKSFVVTLESPGSRVQSEIQRYYLNDPLNY